MTADVELLPCGECGMPCRPDEYHPFAACLMFKACHNSETVRANMEALRAEVREAREFRDKLVKAIGNEQLRAFIEKYGEPVPLTNRVQAAEARANKLQAEVERSERYAEQSERERLWAEERAERLAEALALLPDEHDMIEHNPDEGPRMFCCWQEVKLRGFHDYLITHDKGCWYAQMRALRDQEEGNEQ